MALFKECKSRTRGGLPGNKICVAFSARIVYTSEFLSEMRKSALYLTEIHRLLRCAQLLIWATLLSACGPLLSGKVVSELSALKPGNYRLDPAHTTVLFKVEHLGISSFVGRFNRSAAQLEYVETDPAASSIVADVDMTSLDINRPGFAETLLGCDWLCAGRYRQARFTSRGRAQVQGNRLIFPGDLNFRGVVKPCEALGYSERRHHQSIDGGLHLRLFRALAVFAL